MAVRDSAALAVSPAQQPGCWAWIAHGHFARKGQFAWFAGLVAAPPALCEAGSCRWRIDDAPGHDVHPAPQRLQELSRPPARHALRRLRACQPPQGH